MIPKRGPKPPATDESMIVTLNAGKWKDCEQLADAIRDSVFGDLTVKGFMATEAVDVLRLLWARQVNERK
jgi:hypothetical protein